MRSIATLLSQPIIHLACVAVVANGLVGQESYGEAATAGGNHALAERLTEEARQAGLAGEFDRRQSLLNRAMETAQDYAPAHWESGHLRIDGEWLTLAEAEAAAQDDQRLQRYLELRDRAADTPQDHLQLARWCRREQLDDEGRYHWLQVLAAAPQNKEALSALDLVWHHGELVSHDEARQLRDQRREHVRAKKHWKVRIAAWERALAAGGNQERQALAELRSEVDETAILPFESLAADIDNQTEIVGERHRRLCATFLEVLDGLSSFQATESLARFAVLAPDESLRSYATQYLSNRSLHETVPLLLDEMAAPINSEFELYRSPAGYVSYQHELRTAGPAKDYVIKHQQIGRAEVLERGRANPVSLRHVLRIKDQARWRAPRYAANIANRANAIEQSIAARNAAIAVNNHQISTVLAQITDQDFGIDAPAWWNYWSDYNEYDQDYRPTETERRYVYDFPGGRSCFTAGTPVWTKTGTVPIETLTAGDLVLSQDVETGELAYRPILTTTVRDPSPILEIVVDDLEVRTTLGHPFWVAGTGWRMAKELAAGDMLLTAEGVVEVAEITPVHEARAFNLIVEGASDYFVGEAGLLVHDNTPRRPELVQLGAR